MSRSDSVALLGRARQHFSAFVAALGLLAGGGVAAAPLTLAIADIPGFAPALIAESQGYFVAEGLTLDIIHCVNGRRCLQHLLEGQAQIATVADTPIVMASFGRSDFAVVGTMTTSNGDNKFVARADRGIHRPADLKGKRIGIIKGTSGHYYTDSFLLYHGLERSQVTLVPLDPADPVGPLVRGEVDAVGSYEPMGYKARQQLGAQAVFLPSPRLFNVTYNLVVGKTGVGDADVTKLMRALKRAEALIEAEPARARAIVSARLGAEPALIAAIWGDFKFSLGLDQSLLTLLDAQARWARREGLDAGGALPDYLTFVRTGPLMSLDRRAVTLVK